MEKRYKYLFKNTALFAVASFGSTLISFFLVPIFTTSLSTSEYGTIDIIEVSALLLFYIVSLDISDVVARYALDDKQNKSSVLKIGMDFFVKSGCFVFLAIFVLFCFDLFTWEKRFYLYLFIIYVLNSLNLIISQFLKGIDRVKTITIASVVSIFVKLILAILLLLVFKMGIDGYIFTMIFGTMVSLIILCLDIDIKSIINASIDKKIKNEMISYAGPMAINALGWWVAYGADKYFIVYYKGYALNGIYSVSYKIPSIITILCGVFNQAFVISAVKELDNNDENDFFVRTYGLFNSLLCITGSVLIIFNILFTKILFDLDYHSAWKYSSILILSSIFSGIGTYFGGLCDAMKNNKMLAISTSISALLNILFNILLIPRFGAYGAAVATLISMFAIYLVRCIYINKQLKVSSGFLMEGVVYCLLIVQVLLDHFATHLYVAQVAIFCTIILINKRYIKDIWLMVRGFFVREENR